MTPTPDANFASGAVRSADADQFDFASAPLLGLLGVLRVAGQGGIKYGRFNYVKGMPVHVTLNHVAYHLIRYLLGDRTEDHLSKVAWGAMVANQTSVLRPDLAEPYLLGPGVTIPDAMQADMDRTRPERDARRQAGEYEGLFHWTLADLPEIQELIRRLGGPEACETEDNPDIIPFVGNEAGGPCDNCFRQGVCIREDTCLNEEFGRPERYEAS